MKRLLFTLTFFIMSGCIGYCQDVIDPMLQDVINEKDKDRIFLLGVRSENAQKTNSEGYGIGLHVVNQILRDFGGKISVKQCSNPTIFEIKLPHLLYSNNYLNSKEWKQ